jgi:hypothetical protein
VHLGDTPGLRVRCVASLRVVAGTAFTVSVSFEPSRPANYRGNNTCAEGGQTSLLLVGFTVVVVTMLALVVVSATAAALVVVQDQAD